MSLPSRLAGALLLTSALCAPGLALAQSDPASAPDAPPSGETVAEPPVEEPAPEEEVEISIPGGGGNEIVVTGARNRNLAKSSDQVVSVLSSAEIARTGEGNIAGALGRVTGLSLVGSGLVYVRGLGDRYSLALLNGSPLPSPEPLRRVVPLDLFPTGVIASSLVQKSYSVNYPGEFGGGVINLTTKAVPRDPFLTFGAGVGYDSETTGQLGYTYYGSKSDNTGFDNGARDVPPALQAFFDSGARISDGTVNTQAIAGQLVNGRNGVLQKLGNMPPNFSASMSGGKAYPLGEGELGVIVAAGYSNKYLTREARQQTSLSADLSTLESDFVQVNTDQRIVVNGLFGLGYEIGDSKVRWTNLYIRDTIKQSRLALGNRQGTNVDFLQQKTAWYERQLIDTQVVGEFKLAPGVNLDLRAGYANSQREAPDELTFEYVRTNSAADPFGQLFVNRLNNGNGGDAGITFSDLNEDLVSGGADLSYLLTDTITATLGAAYSDTRRDSSRRDFLFLAPNNFPTGVGLFRPDLLLQPGIIDAFGIGLIETDEGNPSFTARLRNYAGYLKANWQATDEISLDAGVRYEKATQTVDPVQIFNVPGAGTAGTRLKNDYWLPAATLTWQLAPDMQVRLSGSKTIARPQFRELINQPYFDPDSNRPYRGNPLLVDSRLTNAEARYEWYFAPEQRFSIAGFYKRITRPIEAFIAGSDLTTSFANAPRAQLYGAEIEAQKYFDVSSFGGDTSWFANRRFVTIANYTYTKSKLMVGPNDSTTVFGAASTIASDYFQDGAPLTGQSDHIANLQFGFENTERLSQQTLLLSYSSKRVTSRGLNGSPPQPDVIEKPGLRIDFVAREAMDFLGQEIELKFEARNITARKHEEFQQSGANRIDINSYNLGRTLTLSASVTF
ncbi:MAG: TonB-dependent receptor [Novosphingobium sp.]|nr:TonB-dependent receptor [Novosphingobium sp.]